MFRGDEHFIGLHALVKIAEREGVALVSLGWNIGCRYRIESRPRGHHGPDAVLHRYVGGTQRRLVAPLAHRQIGPVKFLDGPDASGLRLPTGILLSLKGHPRRK